VDITSSPYVPRSFTPLGGVRTVTGSRFLIEVGDHRVLVDCGLFQGLKELRARNWDRFPVDPRDIDAVIITHAHLDHCGYLPRLVQGGFRGPVHVTHDTGKLMAVVLPDSARLLEEEARFANRVGYSKHRPALALYTEDDAWAALDLLRSTPFDVDVPVAPGITARFQPAGHILGSAIVQLDARQPDGSRRRLVFSGDLGQPDQPILRPYDTVSDVDALLIESTYADRVHPPKADVIGRLKGFIDDIHQQHAKLVIPAFSVGRTQRNMAPNSSSLTLSASP
jgi:metallo-beta-lactamase family protein